jgi:hypothetical protein
VYVETCAQEVAVALGQWDFMLRLLAVSYLQMSNLFEVCIWTFGEFSGFGPNPTDFIGDWRLSFTNGTTCSALHAGAAG